MKFSILENGNLQVIATTTTEVKEVIDHYKLDVLQYIDALANGNLVHEVRPSARDNAAWFEVSSFVDASWLKPYMDRLAKITGYEGTLPSIDDAPKYPGSTRAHNLQYTHIVTHARITPDGMVFDGVMHCGDWNGKSAATRAPVLFAEYVREGLGARKHEPQYIRVGGGGLMRENPNYLKRHAPHAECTSAALLDCLLNWWISAHATDGQRDIMQNAFICHKSVCKTDTLGSWLLREYQGYRTSWGSAVITFDEFKGL